MNTYLFSISFVLSISWVCRFNGYALPLNEYSSSVQVADALMEKGATNSAYFILKKELKNNSLSQIERYRILKLIARGFLKELDYLHYDEYNQKAFQLVRHKEEIYKAQFMIERAYFFHYLTFADSVLYYAYHAKQIFDRNKQDWNKIEVPFFYRIYGISMMYSSHKLQHKPFGKYGIPKAWAEMFRYFDTSIIIQCKYPYAHLSDIALSYRGFGNRYLDLISGYTYPTKKQPFHITKLGWYAYYKSVYYYKKALDNLDSSNTTDLLPNISLLGLANMCVGRTLKARFYFDQLHVRFYTKFNWKLLPSIDECLTALNYERVNDFNLPYSSYRNKKAIQRLETLIPQWIDFLKSKTKFSYDIYKCSPFNQLYCYYLRAYFHTHHYSDLKKATMYLLMEKNHFKFLNQLSSFEQYKLLLAKNEISSLSKKERRIIEKCLPKFASKIIQKLPKINIVNNIHNSLKADELLLLKFNAPSFLNDHKIVISNKRIYCVKSAPYSNLDIDSFQNYNFFKYKKEAFLGYYNVLHPILKLFPKTKTIYSLYDDNTKYSLLVRSKKATEYSELNYVIKSVNFVTLHNVETYFQNKTKGSTPKLTLIKLKTALKNKLMFMEKFHPKSNNFSTTCIENKDTNFIKFFEQKGMYHLIGHGDQRSIDSAGLMHMNKWFISNGKKTKSIENFRINNSICADLIVLNNCYSGSSDPITMVFDKGLYLQLMYYGASNIIATNDKVDDYVSSKLFRYYYELITQGHTFDVALSMAQRRFLKENRNQYAHPNYWYPYFVISSRKVRLPRTI